MLSNKTARSPFAPPMCLLWLIDAWKISGLCTKARKLTVYAVVLLVNPHWRHGRHHQTAHFGYFRFFWASASCCFGSIVFFTLDSLYEVNIAIIPVLLADFCGLGLRECSGTDTRPRPLAGDPRSLHAICHGHPDLRP